MIELIAHEAGHSWVLPHAEPLWNEPIATYLGIQVGKRLGMPEADDTLKETDRHVHASTILSLILWTPAWRGCAPRSDLGKELLRF